MPDSLRDTIARVAREEGIDPAYALAVAERESNFTPNLGGQGSIRGLYQMTRAARRQVGLPDNASPEDQTRAFARFTKAMQGEMRGVMGRDPTDDETYLGHHFGGNRAGHVVAGHYGGYAPGDVFSPREMAGNPHFGKASSMDALARSIKTDMGRRRSKFGGAGESGPIDFAQFGQHDGEQASPERAAAVPGVVDFSQFGQPRQDATSAPSNEAAKTDTPAFAGKIPQNSAPLPKPQPELGAQTGSTRPGREIDLSQYGQTMAPMPQSVQAFAAPGAM